MMGGNLPSSFGEEPNGQLSQVFLKGRQLGTPVWTAQQPPYAHQAHTGNSHMVKMHIHTPFHLF